MTVCPRCRSAMLPGCAREGKNHVHDILLLREGEEEPALAALPRLMVCPECGAIAPCPDQP